MKITKPQIISFSIATAAVLFSVYIIVKLLSLTSTPISVDGYYHIAVTKFIKKYGFLKSFQWTQMSIWKFLYSDKDLLLHILILPVTWFTSKISLIDKWGIAIIDVIYLTAFVYILRKYVPAVMAALLLILCFISPTYTTYLLYLRPAVLALTFTILGLHFLIQKNKYGVFLVTFLYTLSHISAFTLVVFAVACEYLRKEFKNEVYKPNITYVILGFLFGLVVHPNFPANLITIYINGFLTPIYAFGDQGLAFGREMFSSEAKSVFFNNFIVLIFFGVMFWKAWIHKIKLSYTTIFFTIIAQFYLALALMSNRFWFMVVPLAALAMAAFLKDAFYSDKESLLGKKSGQAIVYFIMAVYLIAALPLNINKLKQKVKARQETNTANEQIAYWMKDNIPKGETIFHSSWSYSPVLTCINPKNNYLVTLDPIYMYYWSESIQKIYQDLSYGDEPDAYYHLKNTFKTQYGITYIKHGFYKLLEKDPRFEILHTHKGHVVFKLLDFYK
jgi:hypothetical protein